MAAPSDLRQRTQQASISSPAQGAKDGSGAKDGQGALKGLLSCIAGVGGVSVFIWVMFFVFLEPYDPTKAVCTHVGSMDELRADVFAVVDPVGLNWQQFGSKLGLSAAQLEELTAAGDSIGESILRFWYGQGKRVCWETVIKALLRIGEKASAGKLTEKYKL